MTEIKKMITGLNYDALDPEVMAQRMRAHDLCHELSELRPSDLEGQKLIVKRLMPNAAEGIVITPPFFCDYGWNLRIGIKFYCNTGCTFLDAAPITIGDHVLVGPNVQLYTATHALDADERAALVQWAQPIYIGDKVWIGGAAIVCPGVSIGSGSVIGAGSMVVKDIPENALAAGNPCRVIRILETRKTM